MGARAEISWNRRGEDGEKIMVYAHRKGDRWDFFIRRKRFDQWEPYLQPLLEDWQELLDGVERRVHRRLQRPEELVRIRKTIKEKFPDAEV